MTAPIRVLICGTGNSAHALVGIFSLKTNVEVRVLTQNADKANQWETLIARGQHTVLVCGENEDLAVSMANPLIVTNDPETVVCGCDIIILAVPASLHWDYLTLVEPYIENGCIIMGLPGQCGFESEVGQALGKKLNSCIIMNFESLPWICRMVEFGKTVKITGTKAKLIGAV
ncbi:unnamed protein product [Rotaria socialis]|uniref:Uncharacterized protein n=1 Tax=Rotaria socialis TaxID=392032 RepID=A0A818E6H4_9BILA|nr:unnamed protein product [Rotaria socialis]CAF3444625.1 unnamed protein product [Rotaria socialis]CAF3747893.1 unnamed protein product [Rotaria socialis]CAF4507458.1 unnamed protein product [Rotaria socialis]CAF4768115.1 unnamed protein product [Rotaria socialis]